MFQRWHQLLVLIAAGFLAGSLAGCGGTSAPGSQGPGGPTGPAGQNGRDGQNGAVGLTGEAGAAGAMGPTGASGATGAQGPGGATGAQGPSGAPGQNGAITGTIAGVLTYQISPTSSPLPATAITVTDLSIIDSVVSTTSGADGSYSFSVPVGIHNIKFSASGYASLEVDGVDVLSGKTATVSRLLTPNNPLTLIPAAQSAPAGFSQSATLNVAVSGGTPPYTYKWLPSTANPTAITFADNTVAAPSFTTGSLAAIIASGKAVGFGQVSSFSSTDVQSFSSDPQIGFIGISAQQLSQMSYNVTVTVTDASGYVKSATVAIAPATLAQANKVVPIGEIVIGNLPGNSAAVGFSTPGASGAAIHDAATANPWFIPDAVGNYVITSGANKLEINASSFTSANLACTTCHVILPRSMQDDVVGKFKDWGNSAHGNHFFKEMHYDNSNNLVWNTDASGNPVAGSTGNPTVNWSSPGAMTLIEFGLSGAEGTHYSGSCISCHTTGYNALASNGGFDDVATNASWSFPNLTNILTSLTGSTSVQSIVNDQIVTTAYNQVTAAPNFTAWNAMPSSVKSFTGMQCESCHGPLGQHAVGGKFSDNVTIVTPVQEFGVETCAVCHDKPANHDKVWLWRQSKHSNLATALAEGAGNGKPSASCNRCHSAQGYVRYLKQLTGTLTEPDGTPLPSPYPGVSFPGDIMDPSTMADASTAYLQGLGITANSVQPQTCAACHEPHSTALRIEGDTPMLPAGFKVTSAGLGAICFTCHNSRNGARNDLLNGVYTNNSNPNTPVSVTSIGAPHEANQGDVVAGRNAFFVNVYEPSAHMAVQDTCVGCHMKNAAAGIPFTTTNHTWKVDTSICVTCHGGSKDPVDGEALQGQFDLAAADLTSALASAGQAYIRTGAPVLPSAAPLYYKGSSQTVQMTPDCVVTSWVGGRTTGFLISFTSAVNNPNAASGTITTLGTTASPAAIGNFYLDAAAQQPAFDQLKGTFAKANWNYELVVQDGSRGVHNPTFTFDVISATMSAAFNTSLPK